MRRVALFLSILLLATHSAAVERPGIFDSYWDSVGDSFTGTNLWLHLGAAAQTPLMAYSGADRSIQDEFEKNPFGDGLVDFTRYFGNIGHLSIGLFQFLYGMSLDSPELQGAGAAVLQALLTTGVYTLLLKYISGRKGPFGDGTGRFVNRRSKDPTEFDFDPTATKKGFFWPSGHTSSTSAFVAALHAYYPEKSWIPWVGYPLVLTMALGMVEGDYHWASDVIAGGLMGHAIGWSVGKAFHRKWRKNSETAAESSVSVIPVASNGAAGLFVELRFK